MNLRIKALERRIGALTPKSITVWNTDGDIVTVQELISSNKEFVHVVHGSELKDLDLLLEYVCPKKMNYK